MTLAAFVLFLALLAILTRRPPSPPGALPVLCQGCHKPRRFLFDGESVDCRH